MACWSLLHEIAVAAYLFAAAVCLRAAFRTAAKSGNRPWFWIDTIILMAVLALNKQFDLELLVTEVGREVARSHGEYSHRREYQGPLIVLIAATCVSLTLLAFGRYRHNPPRHWPAVVGIIFLLGFLVIRTISLHQIDAFLGRSIFGLKWNWIFELGGIALITIGALRVPPASPIRS